MRVIFQKYESFPRINLNFTGKTRKSRSLGERLTIISMTPHKDGNASLESGDNFALMSEKLERVELISYFNFVLALTISAASAGLSDVWSGKPAQALNLVQAQKQHRYAVNLGKK